MRSTTLLFLCLGLLAPAGRAGSTGSSAPASASAPAPQSRKRLLKDLARWTHLGPQTDLADLEKAEKLVRDTDRMWAESEHGKDEFQRALLDFLGRCVLIADAPGGLGLGPEPFRLGGVTESDLRQQALLVLRKRLPESQRELTLEILMGREEHQPHPVMRRIGACEVLKDDLSPMTTLALLSTTRPIPPETQVPRTLLDAAVGALAGRDEEGVHLRLLDLLKRGLAGKEDLWMGAIEGHFGSIRLKMGQKRPVEALALYIGELTQSLDWRRASLGLSLTRALPDDLAFPLLIGALETWVERRKNPGQPTRRVLGEMTRELERRSGRHLGVQPLRWRSLWEGYLRGDVRWYGEQSVDGEPTTVGGFFGLRPESDRLVFLLDRSGSMQASFGKNRAHSRLEEAVDQMAGLLAQLGPETEFNVITFSSGTQAWKQNSMAIADEKNIRAARAWVLQSGAAGGTHLASGVRRALSVQRDGSIDIEALQPDTVIVLCDGGTAEGPTWVGPFLRRVNDGARIVFHAVQLGQGGDGSLEALASQTGGDFQRVED